MLRFIDLWNNYPKDPPCVDANNKAAFENQCAIRVGTALAKSGIDFANFKGPRCTFNAPHNNGMVLRAEELAAWLKRMPFQGCPPVQILPTGKEFQKFVEGRTGIIFFKDYWKRDGEKFPTGDHIDLWNRDRLTPSLATFMRFTLGISRVRNLFGSGNYYSDLEESRQVNFWNIP